MFDFFLKMHPLKEVCNYVILFCESIFRIGVTNSQKIKMNVELPKLLFLTFFVD